MRLGFLAVVSLLIATSAFAQTKDKSSMVDIKIDGMTCDSCVKSVKEKLALVPNVDKATVHVILKQNKATLKVADADTKTLAAIKQAVVDAGFKVVGEPVVAASKVN